jgi:hypothetical protein
LGTPTTARTIQLNAGLRPALNEILAGVPSHRRVREVVSHAHAIAVTLIRSRISRVPQIRFVTPVSVADLAYDVIAELFERDHSGRLIHIAAYFGAMQLESMKDEEILIAFRRLVASTVKQSMFRLYRLIDPALGKILRNVKRALGNNPGLEQIDVFGEPTIAPKECDHLSELPRLTIEEFTEKLCREYSSILTTPDLISRIEQLLRDQEEHSRELAILDIALAIRNIRHDMYVGDFLPGLNDPDPVSEDVSRIISECCRTLQTERLAWYVESGRIPLDDYRSYIAAVEERLVILYADGEQDSGSVMDSFRAQRPGLSIEEYRSRHKSTVEYLYRIASSRVTERIRNEVLG